MVSVRNVMMNYNFLYVLLAYNSLKWGILMNDKLKEIFYKLETNFKKNEKKFGGYEDFVFYPTHTYQETIMVFERPGRLGTISEKYSQKVMIAKTVEEKIRAYQEGFAIWMAGNINKKDEQNQYKQIWECLKKSGLIQYEDLKDFLKNDVHEKVYITDAIKSRSDDVGNSKGRAYWKRILKEEFELLKSNKKRKLIITMGVKSWRMAKKILELRPLDNEKISNRVTDMHGFLFKGTGDWNTFYVIPLTFPGRIYYLRDTYKEFFEEGLKHYKKT